MKARLNHDYGSMELIAETNEEREQLLGAFDEFEQGDEYPATFYSEPRSLIHGVTTDPHGQTTQLNGMPPILTINMFAKSADKRRGER